MDRAHSSIGGLGWPGRSREKPGQRAAPAVQAVHDRAVPGHHVGLWRFLLRRRVTDSVLVKQNWHLECLHGAYHRWRVDTRDEIDEGLDVRGLIFPSRQPLLITRDQGGNELNHVY